MMKTLEQLKHGKCIVVASNSYNTIETEGFYNEKLGICFFAINSSYEIVGYIQE